MVNDMVTLLTPNLVIGRQFGCITSAPVSLTPVPATHREPLAAWLYAGYAVDSSSIIQVVKSGNTAVRRLEVQMPERSIARQVKALALPPLQSVRLLDRLRERIRLLHYSRRTEEVYVH